MCAHLGYVVVHAFYYHLPFSFIDSATLIHCAFDLIADLNFECNIVSCITLTYINLKADYLFLEIYIRARYLNLGRGRNVFSGVRNVL